MNIQLSPIHSLLRWKSRPIMNHFPYAQGSFQTFAVLSLYLPTPSQACDRHNFSTVIWKDQIPVSVLLSCCQNFLEFFPHLNDLYIISIWGCEPSGGFNSDWLVESCEEMTSGGVEQTVLGFKSQLCQCLAMSPWTSCLPSLCLSFFTCKMGQLLLLIGLILPVGLL